MRLLLVNNGYPSVTNPQYSTYVKTIEECLIDCGYGVDLMVLDTNFNGKKEKILNYLKLYFSLVFTGNLKRYDYIFIHNYPYVFIPLIPYLKIARNIVIHWHGTDVVTSGKISDCLNRISYWFLPKRFVSISPSNYFANIIREKLKLNCQNRIIISPSGGVDTNLFISSHTEIAYDRKTKLVLGYSSSLITAKGADLISLLANRLKALSEKCNVEIDLKIIAYGAEKETFVRQLRKIKNVIIESPYPKEKMIDFYQSIDVFLFPTKRKAESLGLVGLEAMSCGIPVVGTNDFALKEYIIPGETGEVFKLGDYDDFEAAIIRAIKNIDKYNPRDLVVKRYSKEAVVEQYKEIFR